MRYSLLLLLIISSCTQGSSEEDIWINVVNQFETAINTKNNTNLLALVSSASNDYDLISNDTYFNITEHGSIFNEYQFDYNSCTSSTVSSTESNVSCSVTATDIDGIVVDFPITATFNLIYENNNWLIFELLQVRAQGGAEEILLDELTDSEYYLYKFLEENGTLFY